MAENGIIKTTLPDGRIQLEREKIDLKPEEIKVPLWTDIADDFKDHVIIENGGINRVDAPYNPNFGSKIIEGASQGKNEIYGGHTAIEFGVVYDIQQQTTYTNVNRNRQSITGGFKDDKVYADKFKNGFEIPTVTVKRKDIENAPNRPYIPTHVFDSLFPNGIKQILAGDNHVIETYSGNDYIEAAHGDNTIRAGQGADKVRLGNGNNYVNDGDDSDKDIIEVGSGRNVMELGRFDDATLKGGLNPMTQLRSDQYVTISNPPSGSTNTVTINNTDNSTWNSAVIRNVKNLDLKFNDKGIGYTAVAASAESLTFSPDMTEFQNMTFTFNKGNFIWGNVNNIEFKLTGQKPNGESVELGEGFVGAAEKIAIKNGLAPEVLVSPTEILALNGAEKSVTITK